MSVAADFASRVLHAITSGEIRNETGLSSLDGKATPVSASTLQHVSHTLERSIADAKYQIETHLVSNFDTLRQRVEEAAAVEREARDISDILSTLTHRIDDPNDGLCAQLDETLKERENATGELERINLQIMVLQNIMEISARMTECEECIAAADYPAALRAASEMGRLLSQLPPWENVAIFSHLSDRSSSIQEDVQGRLEYIVSQGMSVEIMDPSSVQIRIQQSVTAPGLGPQPVALSTALSAIYAEKLESHYLRPFVRMLYKHVVDPLARDPRWSLVQPSSQGRDGTLMLQVQMAQESPPSKWTDLPPGSIYKGLKQVLTFLERALGDQNNENSRPMFRLLGELFWTQLSTTIIGEYLERAVPDEADGLAAFADVTGESEAFEDWLVAKEIIADGNRVLTEYCKNSDVRFANKKHLKLIQAAREIIMKTDYSTVMLAESKPLPLSTLISLPEAETNMESIAIGDEIEDLFSFPSCAISTKAQQLLQLAITTLSDAAKLTPYCAERMVLSTRDMFDLFRAMVPVYDGSKLDTIPQLSMVFYNDCMYLAHECMTLGWRYREMLGGGSEITFIDMVAPFRSLGDKYYKVQMETQRKNLLDCIESAGGFDVLAERRHEIVERAIKQVLYQLTHLSKVWKPVLSPSIYLLAMGGLIDFTMDRIITEIKYLIDIAEEESHKLNQLLTKFHTSILPLLSHDSIPSEKIPTLAGHCISQCEKFIQVTDILDLSFADIMERFRDGRLKVLEKAELTGLIKALFADTPLRVKNLEEIVRGYSDG
ncbi:hypothetical protein SpCBS45565_g00434 [Spizellomyces sp. 'palustris']|nr:hypothetical protein SpCBS45565_g00434 [Spizellomyces sp. 'palustris']